MICEKVLQFKDKKIFNKFYRGSWLLAISRCSVNLNNRVNIEYQVFKNYLEMLYHFNSEKILDKDLFKDSIHRYTVSKKNISHWIFKNEREFELWVIARENALKDFKNSIDDQSLIKFLDSESMWENKYEKNEYEIIDGGIVDMLLEDFSKVFSVATDIKSNCFVASLV